MIIQLLLLISVLLSVPAWATDRTDNFNRADGAIGTPSDGGSAWSVQNGAWNVLSNTAYETLTTTFAIAVLESSVSNVEVEVTLSAVGPGPALVARFADTSNYILASYDQPTTAVYLWKNVAGSFTQFGSSTITLSANDVLKLRVDSSNLITLYVNGVSKVSVTDSAGSTNTKHGIYAYQDDTSRFENFSITEIVAGSATVRSLMMMGAGQ